MFSNFFNNLQQCRIADKNDGLDSSIGPVVLINYNTLFQFTIFLQLYFI